VCLYPKFIINRKYTPTMKNAGNVPQIKDPRVKYVPVGCGKCMECRKQRSRQWQIRLHEEIRTDKTAKFVTMSFTDEAITELEKQIDSTYTDYNLDNQTCKLAIRRFLERWRKKYKKSAKHWLITELGQTNTERIHIHGLIFTKESKKTIEQIWGYGNVWTGDYVNEKTINYIIKYVNKTDQKHKYYTPVILCSPGIGRNYINRYDSKLNKYNDKKTDELYKTRNGIKLPLPIYYRNKIYTDEEKERLWINLLDKNTRYVNGIKIDVSKGDEQYYKCLKQQQLKNKELGYGDDEVNHNIKKYEKQLRNLKRLQRINKLKNQQDETI